MESLVITIFSLASELQVLSHSLSLRRPWAKIHLDRVMGAIPLTEYHIKA